MLRLPSSVERVLAYYTFQRQVCVFALRGNSLCNRYIAEIDPFQNGSSLAVETILLLHLNYLFHNTWAENPQKKEKITKVVRFHF